MPVSQANTTVYLCAFLTLSGGARASFGAARCSLRPSTLKVAHPQDLFPPPINTCEFQSHLCCRKSDRRETVMKKMPTEYRACRIYGIGLPRLLFR